MGGFCVAIRCGGDSCGGVTLPSRYSVSRTNGRLQEEHQEEHQACDVLPLFLFTFFSQLRSLDPLG